MAHDEAFFQAGRGRRTPKGEQAVYPGGHDAIVPEALWRRAQEVRRGNAARVRAAADGAAGGPTPFVLGGVLRCRCGSSVRAGGYRAGSRAAYYVCLKRYHWGKEPPHGCGHPRLRADRVHAAFWGAVSGLLAAPDLADRVLVAARAKADRPPAAAVPADPAAELRKVARDLETWYRRHDAAGSDLEREAAWGRIVQLTARKKELEVRPAAEPPAGPAPAELTREAVERFLADLAGGLGRAPDHGRAVVRGLIERHALAARVTGPEALAVELAPAPPGSDAAAVRLAADARIPADRISEWVAEHQGTRACPECGGDVPVERRHYWRGLPTHHRGCWTRVLAARRKRPADGYYTGQQAADRLGIGRTTLGRWLKARKVPPPVATEGAVLLFDRQAIESLAQSLADARGLGLAGTPPPEVGEGPDYAGRLGG